MANSLVPCGGCGRHVRASEAACPFCGAAVSVSELPAGAPAGARLGRAALFAFGVTVAAAAGAAACGPSTPGGDDSGADGSAMALYGAPAPQDGGTQGGDAAPTDPDGGPVARYGAPPPPDAFAFDV